MNTYHLLPFWRTFTPIQSLIKNASAANTDAACAFLAVAPPTCLPRVRTENPYRGLADLRHFRLCVTGTDSPRGEMQACQGTWSRTSLNTDHQHRAALLGSKTLSSLMPQNRFFRSKVASRPSAIPIKVFEHVVLMFKGGRADYGIFCWRRLRSYSSL